MWFVKQLIIHSSKYSYTIARFLKRRISVSRRLIQENMENGIFAVHGSLVIFTARGVSELPGEYFGFLYSEELFLGLHYYQLGRETVYKPILKVKHAAKETTGKLGSELQRKYIFYNTLKILKIYLKYRFKYV